MPKITTILFDADGVLIRSEMSSRYFEDGYGINHKDTVGFYKGPFLDCLLGKRDMYDVLPEYLEKWGWKKSTEEFVREWFDFENKLDTELVNYIQQLRSRGIGCYVATNQERHRAQYMLERMGFANDFDGLFASAHLGATKPDALFFQKALDQLKITDKASVVFFDDSAAHVEGARKFGINAELYDGSVPIRETLTAKYDL